VGSVTPIAPEPKLPLPETFVPLANLLELIASRVGPQNFPAELEYDDASWVGYRLAELLPLPLHIKQSMLEINDADVRLKVLQQFLAQQGLI
jgi:Lon protease-like protein